jgi:sialate O-acetylesterase
MRKSILLLVAAAALQAQSVDTARDAERVTDLSLAQWRFHTGDDPRWAAPDFDDSRRSLLAGNKSWVEQGYAGYAGVAWHRVTWGAFLKSASTGIDHLNLSNTEVSENRSGGFPWS